MKSSEVVNACRRFGFATGMLGWILTSNLITGCSILQADYQMWENDKSVYFTGIVEIDREARGPLVVVLYRKGESPDPVYINVIPTGRGVYHLGVPGTSAAGRYGIVAFEDVNRDMRYAPGEPVAVYEGKPLSVAAINMPPTESEGLGHIVIEADATHVVVPPIFGDAFTALVQRREESIGGQASIDDARFDPSVVRQGHFQPLRFFEEGQLGLFMLQPFDPGKVPVVLVHGIGGSPRDWVDVLQRLDREHFQPWVAYYPSGVSIGHSALMLSNAMDELSFRYPFADSVVVAHSMGGLVAMGSLNIAAREGRVPPVHHLVTISTPWLGSGAARWAKIGPTRAPDSWLDMAPDSDYLETLLTRPRPAGVCHTLFFGYGGRSPLVKGNNDGVVGLQSVLAEAVTTQAEFISGFDEGHSSILSSKAMQDMLNARLHHHLHDRQCAKP